MTFAVVDVCSDMAHGLTNVNSSVGPQRRSRMRAQQNPAKSAPRITSRGRPGPPTAGILQDQTSCSRNGRPGFATCPCSSGGRERERDADCGISGVKVTDSRRCPAPVPAMISTGVLIGRGRSRRQRRPDRVHRRSRTRFCLSQSSSTAAVSIWVEVRSVYSLASTSSPRPSRARTSALPCRTPRDWTHSTWPPSVCNV